MRRGSDYGDRTANLLKARDNMPRAKSVPGAHSEQLPLI
jgi:hypothetical protein